MDSMSMLVPRWRAVVEKAETVTDNLNMLQLKFKRQLLKDVKEFQEDVAAFRTEYLHKGACVCVCDCIVLLVMHLTVL